MSRPLTLPFRACTNCTRQCAYMRIVDDDLREPNETFNFTFSDDTIARIFSFPRINLGVSTSYTILTILTDDRDGK